MRVLNENLGFIELHSFFLKQCLKYSVPKDALSVLEYPALFKNISKTLVAEFLCFGCDIYIKLQNYSKAFELLSRGINL